MSVTKIRWDPASFRDPEGSVFFHGDNVYRTFPEHNIIRMHDLINSSFFKNFVENGNIIKTEIVNDTIIGNASQFLHLLKHEKIPFITYPYEWSFYMLKDSALLTLSILAECLKNNFVLKDGTAWNITFHKGKMCFLDILSIGTYNDGQIWEGYGQFCREFLYPLLISCYKNIDFHSFFRGSLKGIDPKIANGFFTIFDWRHPGIFKHVFLNSKLTYQKSIGNSEIKNKFHLPKESLINIVNNLKKVIENLHPGHKDSIWQSYNQNNTYTDADSIIKRDFIKYAVDHFKGHGSIVDLGCNTGEYSIIAAQKENVTACDIDPACIDQIYVKTQSVNTKITPVVLDLMNPSAQCGWKLQERSQIFERLKPNSFLALALIHHICIASNVPLESFISFLASISSQGVLEWVDKKDPMVQFLLRNREDVFQNYTWDYFQKTVSQYFRIECIQDLNAGTRKLCLLRPLTKEIKSDIA